MLGYPARADGMPEPEMRERVLEGVREFKAGVAPHLILTGAAAHNRFVEADVMARLAEANGVPATAILKERGAHNTIENAAYSVHLMQAHHWRSAEVISSPAHLPRAGIIFSTYPIAWRTHAARWPREYTVADKLVRYVYEAVDTARIVLAGRTPPR
ncbi:MAG TPA: YdcF family protein [Rhizomicrobium sp.]